MRLARYLFLQLAPGALVINWIINAWLGHVLYPGEVAIKGAGGFLNDTFAAAFLIGAMSWLTVTPGARREAWSGRVPGYGLGFLGWTAKHPFLFAFLAGIAAVVSLAVPVAIALDQATTAPLSHGSFVLAKAGFAAVAGTVAAIACAVVAIAGETSAPWPEASVAHARTFPFEYFDKGALAVTDNARGCSGTPTWQLVVDGPIQTEHVRIAWNDLFSRYPSLATRVESLDGVPLWARRFQYVVDTAFDPGQLFRVVDLRSSAGELTKLAREELNQPLDRLSQLPATLTVALMPDHVRLFFRQHHGIADGRAFIGLLGDFATYLEAARQGHRPSPELLQPVERRSEAEALGLTRGRRAWLTFTGTCALIGGEVLDRLRPRTFLLQNRSNDYSGENGTVHWTVPDAELDRWNAKRKELGVSLNSLLTGALCIAARRWHEELGLPVGRERINLMVETRPRDGGFVSFANHLARMNVDVRLDRLHDVPAAAHAVQAGAKSQQQSGAAIRRLLAETLLTYAMPFADMQKIVFESKRPAINLDFSNLIPLTFPTLGGQGWRAREVLITTPVTPRVGITVTVIRYGGWICFNFNYKSTAATREQTEALAAHFQRALNAV